MDRTASVVFDTTAINTGHVTAACVSLQIKLGYLLFCSACLKLIVCKEKMAITRLFAKHFAIIRGFLLVHVFF